LFSCFALLNIFSAVPRVSGPIFMFRMPRLIFGGTEGVGSHHEFSFSDSFSSVRRMSGPVFMFCAPGLVFGGTDGIRSRFHVCDPEHVSG
jgi:hypothetical protein